MSKSLSIRLVLFYSQLVKLLPQLVHLFTPTSRPMTLKMITTVFKPVYAIEGSNRQARQMRIYKKFIKYLKEVAGNCYIYPCGIT